ncbi:UDP-N-acetylglucosamine transferase subunit ALG14 homolog [Hyla sarda]|uniref:UDP-N-acetylglucosamine transferase subunit ALG14 homolog n=1 Tax=Hyla sarda TaxID=327740 RepID=UPI0024C269F1|nr:UDP-N-acetylglucosamine transferase subunit ALG14 homolog [Hyla sarda]
MELPLLSGGLILMSALLLLGLWRALRGPGHHKPGRSGHVSLMVVAGSGGHTSEVLRLLSRLSSSYGPVHYVLAETDLMSEEKIHTFEASKETSADPGYTIQRIPRSREVRQSWGSSLLSTLRSFFYSFPLTCRLQPDVILCNGPGTCIPICFSAFLLSMVGIKKILIVYVESLCRVESLSLSGRILYFMADHFIVQWPLLKDKYPNSVYLGKIV